MRLQSVSPRISSAYLCPSNRRGGLRRRRSYARQESQLKSESMRNDRPDLTPEDAARAAEKEIKRIFDKWRQA